MQFYKRRNTLDAESIGQEYVKRIKCIIISEMFAGVDLMKICFVLPKAESKAIGGFKIVYEYANRLIQRGHEVYLLFLNTNYLKRFYIPRFIKKAYFDCETRRQPVWFQLDTEVIKVSDYSKKKVEKLYRECDVVIATAVKTARYVAEYFKTDNKIYFIQGRENWSLTDEQVDDTYRLGLKNVVISQWLKQIVDKASGGDSVLIPNPIDIEKYKIINPIENRIRYSIGCLYNPNPCKGFDNAFRVMEKLKASFPEMGRGIIFGAYERPKSLPNWIKYVKNATQEETIDIYNNISVFLCSSIDEGYGLTGLESMACGCALCSTGYAAVHEYAEDGRNCLLSTVGDVDAQTENVSRLFNDNSLRIKIATEAVKSVEKFSWDIAINKFEELIG